MNVIEFFQQISKNNINNSNNEIHLNSWKQFHFIFQLFEFLQDLFSLSHLLMELLKYTHIIIREDYFFYIIEKIRKYEYCFLCQGSILQLIQLFFEKVIIIFYFFFLKIFIRLMNFIILLWKIVFVNIYI